MSCAAANLRGDMTPEPRHPRSHWHDAESAWAAVGEFTAAVAVYGVVGWFADKWLHTGHVLFFVGLLFGMVLGIYVLIKRSDAAESERVALRQSARARH
jgi:F0F1-type ATP synthase assembly protein I